MINNKKIEEAAKQHAEEAFITGYWQACYMEGFLGCATEDVSRHLGKYFGMLIIEAMYADMVDFEIIEEKYKI